MGRSSRRHPEPWGEEKNRKGEKRHSQGSDDEDIFPLLALEPRRMWC